MIDLRFLERTEEVQPSGASPTSRRVRVLQWRQRIVLHGAWPVVDWTEWVDVPLVEADATPHP